MRHCRETGTGSDVAQRQSANKRIVAIQVTGLILLNFIEMRITISNFRISYNQKGEATLFISEISQADEAEYSCRGMNPGGEVIHRAELIVVSAGL